MMTTTTAQIDDDPDAVRRAHEAYLREHIPLAAFMQVSVLEIGADAVAVSAPLEPCLLYTSPSPRDRTRSRMPSSA